MAPINAIQSQRSITDSVEAESAPAADADLETAAPPTNTDPPTASAMASFVPDGGLHPVARKPGTALFGFITAKLREVMSKESPTGFFDAVGANSGPAMKAAKAAGKALGESMK